MHRFVLGIVTIQRSKLAAGVAEQHQKVFCLAARDFLQHLLLGVAIHHAGKDAVLDGVQDDTSIRLGGRLLIQFGA